jgi:hypothetical protein
MCEIVVFLSLVSFEKILQVQFANVLDILSLRCLQEDFKHLFSFCSEVRAFLF